MENYKCKSVGIVGAGIQGVCIGLQLVKKGIPVTIFDKLDPRDSKSIPASYGNAGHFSPYAVVKFNRPDILYKIPKMLFSSKGPLSLKWSHIPKMMPWILNYLKNCNKNQCYILQNICIKYVAQLWMRTKKFLQKLILQT